jgi:hypothetical protein
MKIVNLLIANILFVIAFEYTMSSSIGIGALKKGKYTKKLRKGIEGDNKGIKDVPDMPIYYQGWIKYLHYTEKEASKQKAFFKNIAFEQQFKKGISNEQLNVVDEVSI